MAVDPGQLAMFRVATNWRIEKNCIRVTRMLGIGVYCKFWNGVQGAGLDTEEVSGKKGQKRKKK